MKTAICTIQSHLNQGERVSPSAFPHRQLRFAKLPITCIQCDKGSIRSPEKPITITQLLKNIPREGLSAPFKSVTQTLQDSGIAVDTDRNPRL